MLCSDGFDEREVDWSGFPTLVEKAMLARSLDEEDRDHAAFSVERPRECEPMMIEVEVHELQVAATHSVFDARGRLVRTR